MIRKLLGLLAAACLAAPLAARAQSISGGGSGGFTPGAAIDCSSVATLCLTLQNPVGTTVFSVDKNGVLKNTGNALIATNLYVDKTTGEASTYQGGFFGFSAIPGTTSADLRLYRDAANTLAQRNGTNAQTFNVYNTYTDGSNYERGVVGWISTANSFEIGTEASGTGTARNVLIKSASGVININGSLALSPGNTITGGGGIAGTVVTGSTWLVASPKTVSGLALCNAAGDGAISWVTDSTLTFSSANFGAAVTGGGTNHVPVRCDGSGTPAWKIG